MLNALVALGKFNITVLSRQEGASLPAGVAIKVVDYTSVESLTESLKGFDAVIDTTSPQDIKVPLNLIDATAAAGVYRFIPSDFGMDPTNAHVQTLPVFGRKHAAFEHLQQKAKESGLTWTVVANGSFLDWNLKVGFMGIDLSNKKVNLFDDGNNVNPWTTLETIGKATAAVLLHPEETENRTVYISSVTKSQKQMVDLAKEALGPDGWETSNLDMAKVFEKAIADFKAGIYTMQVFGDMIRYAVSSPDYAAPWPKDDNALLGVHSMSDDEVKDLIKQLASS